MTGPIVTLHEIDDSEVTMLRTDAMIAQELRSEIGPLLAGICHAMDKARAAGLKVDFGITQDAFGRHLPPHISITKAL